MDHSLLKAHYAEKRPLSASFFEQSTFHIAGGVNGNLRYFQPFPITFEKAKDARLVDLDGNQYVDYLLSYGALMLGHGHPVIQEAVQKVWEQQGTSAFGATHPMELEMTLELQKLYPSMEKVRFTNSGLEATLFAIRLGLAYSGKTHIAKFEGHYHGSHDHVLVSVNPELDKAGNPAAPEAVTETVRIPDYYLDHTVVLPFNDLPACEEILTKRKDQIGAIILEPFQSGYIAADQDFMTGLRELTKQLSILLIFDEVKTGFRITLGGAQQFYNVHPDLTALGKVVGGGFPIGVVGGRRDILEYSSPLHANKHEEIVYHSGTFNGNPISLASGLATIRYLSQPGRFEDIVKRTMTLREGIETLAQDYRVPMKTIGEGTIFNLVATEEKLVNYRDFVTLRKDIRLALDYLLMDQGVYSKPLNRFSMSDAHGQKEIEATLQAFEKSFSRLKEFIPV
jgi:glutamate-1-semialdehyde 2,1-aminomutase